MAGESFLAFSLVMRKERVEEDTAVNMIPGMILCCVWLVLCLFVRALCVVCACVRLFYFILLDNNETTVERRTNGNRLQGHEILHSIRKNDLLHYLK